MRLLPGKELSERIEGELRVQAAVLVASGVQPCLAVVLIGDDPASHTYVRNKIKAAERVGIRSIDQILPASTAQPQLEAVIAELNRDPSVHGVLCQMPLPSHLNAERVTRLIDPAKDVDCFHPYNVGLLAMGQARFLPCTPAGVLELLSSNGIPVAGRHAVVLGRSNITIVISPTPPGTGVMASVRGATDSKCTSPTRRKPLFLLASAMRFTPTSITTAPSRTISPRTNSGWPIAAMRISACLVCFARSALRE